MIKELNKQLKNLDIWDIALTKWSVFFVSIAIVKFFPGLLKLDYIFLIVASLLLAARPLRSMWPKRRKK